MKEFSIKALSRIISAGPCADSGVFGGISTDSRTVKSGDCFFAIKGENFDGHDYVADAFAKGACCAIVDRSAGGKDFSGGEILKVEDTIQALGMFAAEYRRLMGFKVIAITGSVGKTTTRQIIYNVLSSHYRTYQSPKNFNNNIGLPLALFGADPADEVIVVELGSNHPGEIAYLTRIAQPDVAVVTNVHPAHLAGFGDMETVTAEKLSIAEGLRQGGTFVINGDIADLVSAAKAKGLRFTTFGRSDGCDARAENISYGDLSSCFTVDGVEIDLPLPGPGNIDNVLAAWAVCRTVGLTGADFAKAVRMLSAVSMRAEVLQVGTLTVINDCYNANPASMENALRILSNLGASRKGRLVFVCGDMNELGPQSESFHAQLGEIAAKGGVGLLLAVGRFSGIVAESARKNAGLQTESFKDTISACNNLAKFIKEYDIVLVKCSRAARLESVVEKLKELFD